MIIEWIGELVTLTDEDWARYSFRSEPLVNRIPPEKRKEYARKAAESASSLAEQLKTDFGDVSPRKLVKKLNLNLVEKTSQSSPGYSMFASFEEPDTINVFTDLAHAADQLINEKGLREFTGEVNTTDLLIAHELYHYFELTQPDLFSVAERIKVWQIGPFKNVSRITCLGEIGAMAFTRELVQLQCSPFIFNVILLYVQNPVTAERHYLNMMNKSTQ
ncbi:MAG TPA: hypothetical protein PLE10_06805 [Brevefilum sp.]|nr:hypothetical protein [Brevefilum sp.]HOR19518.1 hypothetical protein [Brevefilum sp.]HPL68768.1 hypothetical protein [Brevefilum sp.]